ncbi:MAG: hypothetical protein AAB368_08840, partial [bacterium]
SGLDDLEPAARVGGFVPATTFTDSGLTNGWTYYYHLAAVDTRGNVGFILSAEVAVTPFAPPTPPFNLTAAPRANLVALSWSFTAAGTFAVSGFRVFRATTPGAQALLDLASGAAASVYVDATIPAGGIPYYYVLRTLDTGGNLSASSVEVGAVPAIPPDPPAVLAAVSATSWVQLDWTPVTCATCFTYGVSGYRVYRSTCVPASPCFAAVGDAVGTGSSIYLDGTVMGGLTYYYAIRSFDGQAPPNESAQLVSPFAPLYSPPAEATPRVPARAPTGLTILGEPYEHDGMLSLSWIPSATRSLDVVGYNIYRATYATTGGSLIAFVAPGDADAYLDTGRTNDVFYYYRVVPMEAKYFEGDWAAVSASAFTDPAPPSGLTALEGNGTILLNWTPPVDTTYPVTAYRVLRATYPGLVDLLQTGSDVYATFYDDSSAANGTTYFYHVQSVDTRWHASHLVSGEASGTPYAPPGVPGGLATVPGDGRVFLTWNPSAAGTFAVSGYVVYRATWTAAPCPVVVIGTVPADVHQFLDTGA